MCHDAGVLRSHCVAICVGAARPALYICATKPCSSTTTSTARTLATTTRVATAAVTAPRLRDQLLPPRARPRRLSPPCRRRLTRPWPVAWCRQHQRLRSSVRYPAASRPVRGLPGRLLPPLPATATSMFQGTCGHRSSSDSTSCTCDGTEGGGGGNEMVPCAVVVAEGCRSHDVHVTPWTCHQGHTWL